MKNKKPKDEIEVVDTKRVKFNDNGLMVTKPFIITSTGSIDFYANPNKIAIIETAPVDNRKTSFYFNMTKDDYMNYEINIRFNPTRIIQTVNSIVTMGNGIKEFFK